MEIKTLRQNNNWSQEQLAQLSGLNIRTIQRVEKGETVGLETLKSLASVFNVEVSELKNKDSLAEQQERTELEDKAKAEVQNKKGFYILTAFLLVTFVLFFLPNYNDGENLGALIMTGACFAMIIGAAGVAIFQPLGENWEKKQIKQTADKYEKENSKS